jgi:Zn-dependent protease
MTEQDMGMRVMQTLLLLPVFLFAITLHEYAHGWMARRFGDHTAEDMGRLTLDPRAHIDPLGAVMFLISSMAGFGFGWAKPVPVRLGNCRNPLQAMFWVAAAGPLCNLLQACAAVVVLLLLRLVAGPDAGAAGVLGAQLLGSGIHVSPLVTLAALVGHYFMINVALMMFNLIPLPPLDGGRIAVSLLPYEAARGLASVERYGFLILLVLMQLGVTRIVIGVPLVFMLRGLAALLGVQGMS